MKRPAQDDRRAPGAEHRGTGSLATTELEALVQRLVEGYDPERVLLFGSHARGDAAPSSDIDLLVVKRTGRRFLDRLLDAVEAANPEGAVDIVVYTPEELEDMLRRGNPFVTRALAEGRDLYVRRAG